MLTWSLRHVLLFYLVRVLVYGTQITFLWLDTFFETYLCSQVTVNYCNRRKLHLLWVLTVLCLLLHLVLSCSCSNHFKTFCLRGSCAQQSDILNKWKLGNSNHKPGAETVTLNNSYFTLLRRGGGGGEEAFTWPFTAFFFFNKLNIYQGIYLCSIM